MIASLIQLYQKTQPVRQQLYLTLGLPPHSCRHHPTCSQYTHDCIKQYGTIQGLFLGLQRLLTCHPLFKPKHN